MSPASSDSPAAGQGRAIRSRLDRPCDLCRRHKHLCLIPVRGEPCVACKTRNKPCTFCTPPAVRRRTPRSSTAPSQPQPEQWATSDLQVDAESPALEDNDPALNDTLSIVSSESDHDRPIAHPPSLDLEDGEAEESHFVGSEAFLGLMLKDNPEQAELDLSPAALSFRQVSSEPRLPAYFIKHPSLVYGRGPTSTQAIFESAQRICDTAGTGIPAEALAKFQRITLPAMPYIHSKRLETAYLGLQDSGPIPYALLTGIIAHSTSYVKPIGALHQDLWGRALQALDEDYHQPRMRTIQLALLILSSRPLRNAGQSGINLARALGAAQLLGLHMDPTNWTLPRWERGVRKRVWWALIIHDRWRALLYGRPSNISTDSFNVPVPTTDDGDWGKYVGPADRLSFETFIAFCRLTPIIDNILNTCYTVKAILSNEPGMSRIVKLEGIRAEMGELEASLPPSLRLGKNTTTFTTLPTGIRSWQLSFMGLGVLVHQLILKEVTDYNTAHGSIALLAAVTSCDQLTDFVSSLSHGDLKLFWMPYSAQHISNCVNLQLRIALKSRGFNPNVFSTAVNATNRIVRCLLNIRSSYYWDIAEAALQRSATVIFLASRELPEITEVYNDVAVALNLPTSSEEARYLQNREVTNNPAPSADLFDPAFLSLFQVQGSDWHEADLSWLNPSLFDLPAVST